MRGLLTGSHEHLHTRNGKHINSTKEHTHLCRDEMEADIEQSWPRAMHHGAEVGAHRHLRGKGSITNRTRMDRPGRGVNEYFMRLEQRRQSVAQEGSGRGARWGRRCADPATHTRDANNTDYRRRERHNPSCLHCDHRWVSCLLASGKQFLTKSSQSTSDDAVQLLAQHRIVLEILLPCACRTV